MEELKKLVDDFCKEAEQFIADMKAYDREFESKVNNLIEIINGKS